MVMQFVGVRINKKISIYFLRNLSTVLLVHNKKLRVFEVTVKVRKYIG